MDKLKIETFDADAENGYNWPFILVSPVNTSSRVKIFVEGNNSTDYEKEGEQSFDAQFEHAIKYAKDMCAYQDGNVFNMPYLYQQLNQPVIIPVIERVDNQHSDEFYTQMLGRNVVLQKEGKFANLNGQVVAMVNTVKKFYEKQNVSVEQKAGLIGMSTSGVFASRMQLIEPETFDTCLSICSNAVQPLPFEEFNGENLNYPLGTADFEEIFNKPFNLTEYNKAQKLFIVGEKEDNTKYNIAKKPTLHDKETRDLYKLVYGDITIQERQTAISKATKHLPNTNSVVAAGGHSLSGKGNLIMNFIKDKILVDERSL